MGPETAIIIGGSTLAAVAVVASAAYNTLESSFLYSNARLASRKSLDKRQLMNIQEAGSLKEILPMLRETDYYLYVENAETVEDFAAGLEERFGDLLREIGKMTPRKFHPVLDQYHMQIETQAIKVLFRSRFSGKELEKQSITAFEALQPVLFHSLMNTKTVADMRVVLRNTRYSILFERSFESITMFDQAIDAYIRKLKRESSATFRFHGARMVKEYFECKADIELLLAVLALHIRHIEPSARAEITASWDKIQGIDMKKLSSEDIKGFIDACARTPYHEPLLKALKRHEDGEGYRCFEHELQKLLHKQLRNQHMVGSFAVLKFIEQQIIEQQNLLVAARGAVSGTTTEQLMIYGDSA